MMQESTPRTLYVCVRNRHGKGASCAGRGALDLLKDGRTALAAEGIGPDELTLRPVGCLGLCRQGPVMVAAVGVDARAKKPPKPRKRDPGTHVRVAPEELRELLREALLGPL